MIDKNLLESLSSKDREEFAKGLEELISKTYEVEREFVELKELFEQVLEVLPNALWVLEENGNIFYQNSLAKELGQILELVDFSQTTQEISYQNSVFLAQVNHKLHKKIVSLTDITQEKRRERLVSMGQISAHLAHEIRNPIGSVALLASTLMNRVDVQNKGLVLEMNKSIWRIERIIKATLLFTKGAQAKKTKIFIDSIKMELLNALSYYTYSKNITLNFCFNSGENNLLYADFELLCILLQNFLFNAIDAIEESEEDSGVIEISFTKEGNKNIFKIFDTGIPIENEEILFEPFKSSKLKGNGLGLALCLQIIAAHNGQISLIKPNKEEQKDLPKLYHKGFKIEFED